ncbi:ComEC/Rec2 family competence protein [Streptococcus infantis]|uniref:ComEC/Rec2 family competence protein n=1 Tax=Streptococcus infantis TaxID=68892 RepID=UPI001CBC0D23|nr:ComEC/Rec2 family competence protein [Streptococcus infantis]MBZ2110644.1 ComEC/Rec2 family competence protein [Streptococcus infantis]MBZ2112424.1 ComEC/Rec2 family competence protein [Streptococcus infantis]MBZ2118661.1 ComEC/Rec2 family competence protein [Streptococcus infantis]
MSQWISRFPIPKIYLSFLLLWLYYAIFSASFLALLGFVFLLLCLFFQFPWKTVTKVLFVCGLFGSWFIFQKWQQEEASQHLVDSVNTVRILPDTIKVNGDRLSFRGKADGRLFQVYYKFQSEAEKERFKELSELHEIVVKGKLAIPQGANNFAGFDYRNYLKTKGIYQTLTISEIVELKQISSWDIGENLSSLRRKAVVWIKRNFPDPMRNYMTGLLLGHLDTDFEEMNELYSSLGIIHLFALSGMQVGFFMNAFKKSLLRLGLTQEKFKWLAYPFSLFYAGLTGFSASVIRSLLQKILSQHGFKGLDNFAMTVLLLFIVMTNFFLTAGGVLSCAYAFILTMTGEEVEGIKGLVRESFIISLGILPILSFYFSEFQPWSILLTFVFSFLFDMVLLPLLSILFCLSFIYPITQFNFLFEWLENIIRYISQLSTRPLVFGQPSLWVLVSLLISLALVYDHRKNLKKIPIIVLFVLALFFVIKHPLENEITVLAMNQGRSTFLRDMTGKTILIDVGREKESEKKEVWQEKFSSSTAQRNLIPYLKSRGVSKIDQLVLTTSDAQQLGNLRELTKAFEIDEVLLPEGILEQKDFIEKLKTSKVKVGSIKKVEDLSIFGSRLEVGYLSRDKSGENSDSLFLHGKLLNQTFLLANNIKEKELSKQYPNLQVDVVITDQTASKGQSDLENFNMLNPNITIISADQKKNFKTQHQASVLKKRDKISKVHHTNQQGAIRFKGWTTWNVETIQ